MHYSCTSLLLHYLCNNFTYTSVLLHHMHFICTSLLLHSTSQQLNMYFTTASLALNSRLTEMSHESPSNFTCTSLLLHLHFTAASQQHLMHYSCTSLMLHLTSQQLHMYFTVAALELHSSFTAISMHFSCTSLLIHSASQQLHKYFTNASLVLHNNFTHTALLKLHSYTSLLL